jgi:hypothetical protein
MTTEFVFPQNEMTIFFENSFQQIEELKTQIANFNNPEVRKELEFKLAKLEFSVAIEKLKYRIILEFSK